MDPNSWSISDIAIRRPVFTTMVMVGMMVLGIVAFFRLPVDLFPDVSFPLITVVTPYPGAGPEEVEELVTRPIEDAVSSLSGIDTVRSYSREGVSTVIVQFEIGTDIKTANLDVRDRVNTVRRDMPRDVMEPSFLRLDPAASPVATLVLGGDADPRELRRFADDDLRPIFEQCDGVASVTVKGGAVREIGVELDADKLLHYGVSVGQVSQALASENLNVPAGRMTGDATETSLRLQGRYTDLDQIRDTVVSRAGGELVRVRDIGEVVDHQVERRTMVRVNGQEAVSLEVVKQSGGNTVAVAEEVKHALEKEALDRLPPGWTLDVAIDSSGFIEESLDDLKVSILVGGLAAIGIIFLFMLDWRSTFISALALPTSVVATFFAMYMVDFSLNMMTMMGLSLAIGFLIDDAIVVRENIYRHIEEGSDPVTAASVGTKEIALAVLATTTSILAVFIPVGFTGGMIGMFFRQFAFTVAIAVTISLFVAFTLDPMLSARMVKAKGLQEEEEDWGPLNLVRSGLDSLDHLYRDVLEWSLRWKITTMMLASLIFFLSLGSVALMGSEFVPKSDRGQFGVSIFLPAGSSLEHTSEVMAELERITLADPDTELVYTTIGVSEEARRAGMRITMVPKHERLRKLEDVMDDFRKEYARVPGIKFSFQEVGLVEGDADIRQMPVSINVRGDSFDTLVPLADRVSALVKSTPGIVDADSTWSPGSPELSVVVDREETSRLGISAGAVGSAMRAAVVGDTPTRFKDGESDWEVRVRLRPEDRNDRTRVEALPIPTYAGVVPLRQVARLQETTGPSTIEREQRQRQITVSANVLGRSLGEVVGEIESNMADWDLPEGTSISFGGETEQMRESGAAFGVALLLAIIFTYIVLASQFESFVHPATIMASLPLALVGALLALFLTGKAFGMSSFIGIILLMGLVTKNAILLVDQANQLRDEEHLDKHDALLKAGPRRLRPILMTSAAMVLGMLPTAMSTGSGSEFRSPMAIVVIGGVITSTVLTLVVVPVLYTWFDVLTARHRREKQEAAARAALTDQDTEILGTSRGDAA
ncbi:MAG: efflux RND transporter permease subunit [Alphaproteobacteria bacterium]|nr:efflux RND transporter permease subunit [Alphaproteobacteria bacterium]